MLSHVNEDNEPTMVDVSAKVATLRIATAQAIIDLPDAVCALFADGDIQSKKGPVFQTARLAGVMASKKTHDLIPLCHPLGIENCRVDIELDGATAVVKASCTVTHKTGVEMEALTAATVAALTVYDMCKAVSHDIVIRDVRLVSKTGGKSDYERLA